MGTIDLARKEKMPKENSPHRQFSWSFSE